MQCVTSLGSGGFGSVHEAHWGNQPCAVKTFFLSQTDLDQQAIQNEIAFLQTLRHRHIIQFYRTHQEYGRTYLLMELAEKGSLEHAIVKGRLGHNDWPTKMRIASEIAQGLAFIHQEKVIHRDLKSANVLLTRHMEVKLADFGLAQVKSMTLRSLKTGSQSRASLLGTLRWIAPELLFAKKPVYTAKSDVYALGVVMWEMAANCARPFKDQDNDACVALAISQGERETFPDDTPTEYRSWIERCWHQDPIQRPYASEVIEIHADPTKESTENDGDDVLDFSFDDSQLDLTGSPPRTHGFHQDASEVKTTHHENADLHIGRLPSADDEVVAHMCMEAKQGSVEAQLFLGWIYDHGHGVDKSDKDAFWWYRLAASHGTVVAQIRVAKMYEHGQSVDVSYKEAASWYLRAAEGGSVEGQYRIADMYADGRGVKCDEEEALRWYRRAAEQGQRDAQYELWEWYSLGRHVQQSDEEAFKWLTMAAQQGNMDAQYELGMMYCDGRGVAWSVAEAVKWLTLAAEQGDTRSQHHLYLMYDKGEGVERSTGEAVKWLTKAAEQGSQDAQFDLGFMYKEGRGVEQNDDEAVKWLTKAVEQQFLPEGFLFSNESQQFIKAAEHGIKAAQFYLGMMYTSGVGVKRSETEAVKLYTLAAEQGYGRAQNCLGCLYDGGQGVEQSTTEAVKWYTKAAAQGILEAQFELGCMFKGGRGVEQSNDEAFKWFIMAAEQGNAESQDYIGLMYQNGEGAEQSASDAVKWYTRAAEQRHRVAQFSLGLMFKQGNGVDQSDIEAAKWFSRAAERGTSGDRGLQAAQFELGLMYEEGRGVERSHAKAVKWYAEASSTQHFHREPFPRLNVVGRRRIPQSETEIFKWFTKAADHGIPEAQLILAQMSRTRRRVKQVMKGQSSG
ncbi:hypothetical protein DFQ26_001911 [Actinomortierella ambigua]|nr:hypothetical protein DFQ26_001911 [Actinomortierella ambigua]